MYEDETRVIVSNLGDGEIHHGKVVGVIQQSKGFEPPMMYLIDFDEPLHGHNYPVVAIAAGCVESNDC